MYQHTGHSSYWINVSTPDTPVDLHKHPHVCMSAWLPVCCIVCVVSACCPTREFVLNSVNVGVMAALFNVSVPAAAAASNSSSPHWQQSGMNALPRQSCCGSRSPSTTTDGFCITSIRRLGHFMTEVCLPAQCRCSSTSSSKGTTKPTAHHAELHGITSSASNKRQHLPACIPHPFSTPLCPLPSTCSGVQLLAPTRWACSPMALR